MAAPAHRVQLLKNESAADGGDAADENLGFPAQLEPGEDAPEAQGFFLVPPGGPADEFVYVTRDGSGNLVFKDVPNSEATLSDLLAAAGLTPATHLALDTLVHCIAETSFDQIVRTGFLVTGCITWTDALMTTKVREVTVAYNVNNQPETVTTTQYDAGGIAAETIVETIAYTGLQADSITRTKTL